MDSKSIRDRLSQRMFGNKVVENRWRGDVVEEFVAIAIGGHGWKHVSADWAPWDFIHEPTGLRLQAKQTAVQQTWGKSVQNRFGIAPAKGFYKGALWRELKEPRRLSEIYLFAHNPVTGTEADHWAPNQWCFWVVPEADLPNAKSVSVNYTQRSFPSLSVDELVDRLAAVVRITKPLDLNALCRERQPAEIDEIAAPGEKS